MKTIFSLVLLTLSIPAYATVLPLVTFRSQGFNAARELVGWQTLINKSGMCTFYTSFNVTPEYTRSYWSNRITESLFSDALVNSVCNGCQVTCIPPCKDSPGSVSSTAPVNAQKVIKVQGTKLSNRDPQAFMAENFYLPTDFSSEISFKPIIDNTLLDLNLYVGLDNLYQGLYFRIHAPICHSRWNLNFKEKIIDQGKNNYDPGYFNDSVTSSGNPILDPFAYGIKRSSLLNNFAEYVCGCKAITDVPNITFNTLNYARMSSHWLSKTAVAELTAAFGWNFLLCDTCHLGLNARAAAPTGTSPLGQYVFEPIVGNGHHWEVGLGLTSHWRAWSHETEFRDFSIYIDANMTHLCKTRQRRTFDLCGKPLSRYMLAMRFIPQTNNLLATDDSGAYKTPPSQFAKEFTPVANLTTIPVDVSAAVQGDLVIKCSYTYCNFQWDIGYNLWGRSCLKICPACKPGTIFCDNSWGLKGNAFIFGFPFDANQIQQPAVPLSATQNSATIFSGTDNYPVMSSNNQIFRWNQNINIDNPQAAFNGAQIPLFTHTIDTTSSSNVFDQTATSLNPILLTSKDLDLAGARNSGLSHKLFTHFEWLAKEYCPWTPYIGAGIEVEFGQQSPHCFKPQNLCNSCPATGCFQTDSAADFSECCTKHCSSGCCKSNCCTNSCTNCSLSQWGIWIKCGFSYN